jgi:hypothetical protein
MDSLACHDMSFFPHFYDEADLFADFELRLQWKAFVEPVSGEVTTNSEIFLRAATPARGPYDDNFYNHDIEVRIDDTGYDFPTASFAVLVIALDHSMGLLRHAYASRRCRAFTARPVSGMNFGLRHWVEKSRYC